MWVKNVGQVGELSSKFQNHPLREAFRKIMLNLKIKPHPGSQIFEKVASNSLKIENVRFQNHPRGEDFFFYVQRVKGPLKSIKIGYVKV